MHLGSEGQAGGSGMDLQSRGGGAALERRLRLFDAVVIGLGSMVGAGIFAAPAPGRAGGGVGAAGGVGARGDGGVLQRHVVGPARRPLGSYVWPGRAPVVAVAAVGALTAVDYVGVQRAAWLTRATVAVVLAVPAAAYGVRRTSAARRAS